MRCVSHSELKISGRELVPDFRLYLIILSLLINLIAAGAGICLEDQNFEANYHQSDEIIVTASKYPTTFSETTRSVTVINRREIEHAPVQSIQDLLEYAVSVDVQQRGPQGIQADVSIRGGTFEQTLILINGLKVSDPQTGHHHLNLPLTLADIDRIEILRGHGSRLYGPNAFGGVINIITRDIQSQMVTLKTAMGEYGLLEGVVSVAFPATMRSSHRLSLSHRTSDGYRENTEFDDTAAFYTSTLEVTRGEVNLSMGYREKEFGANSFYSDYYPKEWEKTGTTFMAMSADLIISGTTLTPQIYWRQNTDDFILDRDDPEFYHNQLTTNVYGVEIALALRSRHGLTTFGSELSNEEIGSESLGNHSRMKGGFYLEHRIKPLIKLNVSAGVFASYYPDWGWNVCPGLDAGYTLSEVTRLTVSVGRSFRVPTFTELYYDSPANKFLFPVPH